MHRISVTAFGFNSFLNHIPPDPHQIDYFIGLKLNGNFFTKCV